MRRTLLGRISRAQRRRIHARVAEALEALHGDAALLEIAHHLCEAHGAADRGRACAYAMRAAERAVEDLAYAEAVDFFTKARTALPPGDERSRTVALKRAVAFQALFHATSDAAADPAPPTSDPKDSDDHLVGRHIAHDLIDPSHLMPADPVGVLFQTLGTRRLESMQKLLIPFASATTWL